MPLQASAAPATPRQEKRIVSDVPKSPVYVEFVPQNQTNGRGSPAATSPLLWLGAAFIAYQARKKK